MNNFVLMAVKQQHIQAHNRIRHQSVASYHTFNNQTKTRIWKHKLEKKDCKNKGKSYYDYGLQCKEITAMIDLHLKQEKNSR